MLQRPDVPTSFRFSTADVPACERANAVRALRERGIIPLEPLPDRAVHVRIAKRVLPGVGILSGLLCGVRQESAARPADGNDDLLLGVNLAGRSFATQRGREIALGEGDGILLTCARGAFAIVRPAPARFVGLRVPRKAIAPLVRGLDDAAMRAIPADTDALRLLTGYLRALTGSEALSSPEASLTLAAHLHDLIALSVGPTRDGAAQDRSLRAARLRTIKSDIVANLADGALTVAATASRHRVSPRYLHKLFESEGTTYTQFILCQRLDRAYRLLLDPRFAAHGISAIAYDVGFGDLSYFNRAFRRRYNATPSDIRNGGRA